MTQSGHGISRASMAIAAVSTIVEWYDFTLYLYLATVLSRVFFGGAEGSLIATLAGFALAYLLRPLGAIVFGQVGDRHGRRAMMLLSMALMTLAMLATALLPTYATVGPAAGWLLLVMRCVIGFSVGGEYTGVVAYLLEGAAADRRGLITSSASAASEIGGLLAVGVSALTVHALSRIALDGWGWRIPFFVGAALGGQRLDRPYGDAGIARFRTPARRRHRAQRAAALYPDPSPQRPVARPSPSRPWARSLITSASPMCPPSSLRRGR